MLRGASIKRLWESLGPVECLERLQGLLASRQVRPEDFSLRELAESFCGPEWVRRLSPRYLDRFSAVSVQEAGEGVDVSAFANITGQIVYSRIHQGWDETEPAVEGLFLNVPTNFDGEKVPGIGKITSEGEAIRPGGDYPEAGYGEHYWESPSTTKHGLIVSVTKEAIFFDHTNLVTRRAGEIGSRLKMGKAAKCWGALAGVNVTIGNEVFVANNHKWNGTTYNTYSTTANAIGINSKATTPLVDYTSVETAWLLFQDLLDADTARPITITPDTIVTMPYKHMTAKRIQTATEVRTTYPGMGESSPGVPGNVTFMGGSPLPNLNAVYSALLYQIVTASGVTATNAREWWFLIQARRGLEYRENWPLTTIQAPLNSPAEFERDIVLRWKSSERGVPWVADPRYMTKMYNA